VTLAESVGPPLWSDMPEAIASLGGSHRLREQGVRIAVAANLALPYAAPLKALLGDLVEIWHFSFDAGVIKPDRAFYAGLTARLECETSELLMVGDTWPDDIVGAVEAGARARWIDREGRASHARRFIAARELGDAYSRYPALLRNDAGTHHQIRLVFSKACGR